MICHVLKVYCKDGIPQVLDLFDSDFDVLCFELVVRLYKTANLVVSRLSRINFYLGLVGLCTLLSLGLFFDHLVQN